MKISVVAIVVVLSVLGGGAIGLSSAGSARAQPTAGNEKAKPKADPFQALRALEGRWRGTSEGQSGKGTVERSYEFVMNGRFLHVRNTSTYEPQEKNAKGEKHEDWGMYSYDRGRKSLVFRQFHVEGFVNQYIVERVSEDGKEIAFVTESIENLPAGYRGRETYTMTGTDTMRETFEIAEPGKEFQVYSKSELQRVK